MQKSVSAWIGRPPRSAEHADAAAAERAGEAEFAHAFGQRHHGGERHRGRAADEDVHAERLAGGERRRVVDADRAVDLVVQADLAVRLVLVAGKLHAVHAEVRAPQARLADVFGVDLRQRDERAAVVGPADLLRQLRDRGAIGGDRRRARRIFGNMQAARAGRAGEPPRVAGARPWDRA